MTTPVVAIRLRPFNSRELRDSHPLNVVDVVDQKTILITDPKVPLHRAGDSRTRQRRFTFSYCFDGHCTQSALHDGLSTEVQTALKEGKGACVLAYGQSASGKTHTVLGNEVDPGLGPRLCSSLFPLLCFNEEQGVEISYLEIYNERVKDLLTSETDVAKGALRVREHPQNGTYVQNLVSKNAKNLSQLLDLIRDGSAKRSTGATKDNPKSSRRYIRSKMLEHS